MNDDEAAPSERGGDESGDQLVHAFVSSTHVWAARDRKNQPCALWGVGPASQDQEVGRFWLLTSEEIGAQAHDMVALSIMILPEMLSHYRRLESLIDAPFALRIDSFRDHAAGIACEGQQNRLIGRGRHRAHAGCVAELGGEGLVVLNATCAGPREGDVRGDAKEAVLQRLAKACVHR